MVWIMCPALASESFVNTRPSSTSLMTVNHARAIAIAWTTTPIATSPAKTR